MPLNFSRYDARKYQTLSVTEGYTAWSQTYDDSSPDDMDFALLDKLVSIDWSGVETAVDLACGTGRIGQWLSARGVKHIDGVDLVPDMLSAAEAKSVYRNLLCEDLREISLADECANLVTSSLAIEHVPDLVPPYEEVDRLLSPGGRFVIIGYHPFFLLSGIPTHFDHGERGNLAIQNYIHLLSDHVKTGRRLDWAVEEMHERVVDDDWVRRMPNYSRHAGRPISFAIVWRKPG